MADAVSPLIAQMRRDRWRLRTMERVCFWGNLALLAWCVSIVVFQRRYDIFYCTLYAFTVLTGLTRLPLWKMRAIPRVVLALRAPDSAVRDAAWEAIEGHRDEVLKETELWARRDEADLETLPREGVVARLERSAPANWWAIGRIWLIVWLLLGIATMIGMALYVPDFHSNFGT